MKKKFLALALAASIGMSLVPVTTGYAVNDSANSKEVQFLVALDIMSTDEITGFFWDETPVKRLEMAQILCGVFDLEVKEDSTQRFVDVSGEARKYVETIVRNGVMSGYSETSFGPEDYVTNKQIVKIILSMLGAETIAKLRGGYPDGYMDVAEELGLILNTGKADKVTRRIDVAELLYNAMHADYVQIKSYYNGFADYETVEGETFLTERLGIYRASGIVSQNANTSLARPDGAGKNFAMVGDELCIDKEDLLEDYLGLNVTVYVKKEEKNDVGEVIYVEEGKKNNVLVVKDEDILPNEGNTFRYYENNKIRTLSLSPIADMIYNGSAIDKDLSKLQVKNGFLKLIDNNGDKEYDVLTVTDYETYVLDSVNVNDEKLVLKFGEAVLSLKDAEYKIYRNGDKATLADLIKGDVLSVAKSVDGKVIRIDATDANIMGAVETVTEDGPVISGDEYDVSAYFNTLVQKGKQTKIKSGDTGKYSLDVMGRIVYYTATVQTATAGYLVDYRYNDEESDVVLKAKIQTGKGKIEEFTFADVVTYNGSGVKTDKLVLNAEFMTNLATPQLIEYEAENEILKSISMVGNVANPDSSKFSLDVFDTLSVTETGMLEHKYKVDSDTKIFRVPSNSAFYGNEYYYEYTTGPYFAEITSRQVWLYDVDDYGHVKYVVTKYDPQWSEIGGGNGVAVVTSKSKGVGTDGSLVDVFTCINENGDTITIKTDDYEGMVKNKKVRTYDEDGNITDVKVSRDNSLEISVGDVIQYKTNMSGYLHAVVVQHQAQDDEYYTPEKIEISDSASKTIPTTVFGKVMRNDGNQFLLTCDKNADVSGGIEVANKLISNTGKAVLKVTKNGEKAKVQKIAFSEILPEDKVFACVSSANVTKMIVVYE